MNIIEKYPLYIKEETIFVHYRMTVYSVINHIDDKYTQHSITTFTNSERIEMDKTTRSYFNYDYYKNNHPSTKEEFIMILNNAKNTLNEISNEI